MTSSASARLHEEKRVHEADDSEIDVVTIGEHVRVKDHLTEHGQLHLSNRGVAEQVCVGEETWIEGALQFILSIAVRTNHVVHDVRLGSDHTVPQGSEASGEFTIHTFESAEREKRVALATESNSLQLRHLWMPRVPGRQERRTSHRHCQHTPEE